MNYQRPQQGVPLPIKIVGSLAALGFLATLFFTFAVNYEKIQGDQRAVVQDWSEGVLPELWADGTHFYIPIKTTPTIYNIGSEKFVMGKSKYYTGEGSDFANFPAYTVMTGGKGKEQPATFSVTLNYRLDPTKLITLHNRARKSYEDVIIKPALTKIIRTSVTKQEVLDFFTGEGNILLQETITNAITSHPTLSEVGIVVENFVIDSIDLDPEYITEIQGRQIAIQKKLREKEETLAALERANREEATAQADKLRRIVQAEAKKQEQIKAAEAANESEVLAAKAASEKTRLDAAADRYRKEQDAKGALALGMAEAKVAEAKRNSKYSGESGLRKAQVEIAKYEVEKFKNMKLEGILDKDVALSIIKSTGNTGGPIPTLPVSTMSSNK